MIIVAPVDAVDDGVTVIIGGTLVATEDIISSGPVDGKPQDEQGGLIPHRTIGKSHGFDAIIIAGVAVFYRYSVGTIGKIDNQVGAIVGQLQIISNDTCPKDDLIAVCSC